MRTTLLLTCVTIAALGADQAADKQVIATISGPDLKGGIVSEITWDGGVLLIQGVFAKSQNELGSQYFVVPADGTNIRKADAQTSASAEYWRLKANRTSPTGLGRISAKSDAKMPQYGIGSLERRMSDATDLGGTQTRTVLRLGDLTLLDREGPEPYDGETWSWSPAQLNRIAYVDGKGDLWVATADGRDARRLLKGAFTLPAWSDDGSIIAVAEKRDGGRRWEISVLHLPDELRRPSR
jgi:hypothetical protein